MRDHTTVSFTLSPGLIYFGYLTDLSVGSGVRRLRAPDSLVYGDVLADESRDLVGLLRLDARYPLLHQVAALHVQEEGAVLGLHLARRYHLKERGVVMRYRVKSLDNGPIL